MLPPGWGTRRQTAPLEGCSHQERWGRHRQIFRGPSRARSKPLRHLSARGCSSCWRGYLGAKPRIAETL